MLIEIPSDIHGTRNDETEPVGGTKNIKVKDRRGRQNQKRDNSVYYAGTKRVGELASEKAMRGSSERLGDRPRIIRRANEVD